MGLERPTSAAKHRHIPAVGKWTEQDKKYWIDLYKKLDSSGMVDLVRWQYMKIIKKLQKVLKMLLI